MRLLREDILFRPLKVQSTTKGGLLVPDTCAHTSNRGVVVAVGSSKKMKLQVGQIVHRVKDWGEAVEFEGQTHYIMRQDCILAIAN